MVARHSGSRRDRLPPPIVARGVAKQLNFGNLRGRVGLGRHPPEVLLLDELVLPPNTPSEATGEGKDC